MNQSSAHRFDVHKVDINSKRFNQVHEQDIQKAWEELGKFQACSHHKKDGTAIPVKLFDSPNLFAATVYTAFYEHYPLKINPNIVWLTIAQGFSSFVDQHAEELRHKFVSHEGKKTLLVQRPDFVKGNPNNDWEGVFPEFADQIEKYIGSTTRSLIECNFSNTSQTDRLASHITLMDINKHYFEYVMMCGCGIPYIELLGNVEDWELLKKKTESLREFSIPSDGWLGKWLDQLGPVLDHFISAAQGHPDLFFWGSVCNLAGGSGGKGSPVTGWVQVFFPYLTKSSQGKPKKNKCILNWAKVYEEAKTKGVENVLAQSQVWDGWGSQFVVGVKLDDLPSGLSEAPVHVIWLNDGSEQDLFFYGGLVVTYQHPDGALEVRTGWGVVESPQSKK